MGLLRSFFTEEYEDEEIVEVEEPEEGLPMIQVLDLKEVKDAITVAKFVMKGVTVAANLGQLDEAAQVKVLDYMSGFTLCSGGAMKQASEEVFLFTPKEIKIHDHREETK